MSRKRMQKFLTIVVLMLFGSSLIACEQSFSEFSGSSTGNDRQFLIDFDVLNTTESNHMQLKNGDSINTTIDIKKGKVDLLVKNEKGSVAYEGKDVESGTFTIGITEPGDYTFSVTGEKAKGSVHFIKDESKA